MFRSIIVKGMEALITEWVLGASRYRAEAGVSASLAELFPGSSWSDRATNGLERFDRAQGAIRREAPESYRDVRGAI